MACVKTVRHIYDNSKTGGVNVGITTPVELISSFDSGTTLPDGSKHGYANQLEIFDSSGQTMELMFGPSGSETRACIIPQGGNNPMKVDVIVNNGVRVSVRAISDVAAAGEININFYYKRS